MTNYNLIAQAADKAQSQENSIDQFIHECCFVDTTSSEVRTSVGVLQKAYAAFCEQNQLPIASRVFLMVYLRQSGIETMRTGQGPSSLVYKGIRLRTEIQSSRQCSLPTHHIYDNKKAHCPGSCSRTSRDDLRTGEIRKNFSATESGINKSTKVLEATKDVGRALVNLAGALREYVVWYVST